MVHLLYPGFRNRTVETMVEELSSFSLTPIGDEDCGIRRIYSNFRPIISALQGEKRPVPVPKAPGQALIDSIEDDETLTGNAEGPVPEHKSQQKPGQSSDLNCQIRVLSLEFVDRSLRQLLSIPH